MNTIPGDTDSKNPSGIRLGTPAITTRGFDEAMSYDLGICIARILLNQEIEEVPSRIKLMLDKIGPFYK